MDAYDIATLPLPIRPGDHVYFVWDSGEIEEAVAISVGIDINGIVQIEAAAKYVDSQMEKVR